MDGFEPTQSIDKIVNYARIKGAAIDGEGESWLATVEDKESQDLYGVSEEVWTLPTAYTAADAERWGQSELAKYKNPVLSAKATGVKLKYPKPDGVFWVRRLSVDGQALITDNKGKERKYPITKLKYTISGEKVLIFLWSWASLRIRLRQNICWILSGMPAIMNFYSRLLIRSLSNNMKRM